tara:strand:- start:1348 stop:4626 length:3279 start_codon:yes stop_codon:yes gene_type:complete
LVGPKGEKKLTELQWKDASAQWGKVRVNKNAGGGPLKIAGNAVAFGIGTHANSLIAFDLPEGYERFVASGGLDNGGTDQSGGDAAEVEFLVYTAKPALPTKGRNEAAGSHEVADALDGLDVGDGLAAMLFAAEPQLLSPSNIDIDHRGRVWVCEIVNYRRHQGKRAEGDRILILEDSDGDGQADTETVFYQGTDIDSPHGVCVLGDKVIVSAGDKVWLFTDSDGDDKPDDKQVLFSGISGTQHDHGIHAFTFGPDGKLYFNFGNAGNQIKDKDGNPIIDAAGNEVAAKRQPYQEGMVFRCNLDGSDFETLGWNFRNNWMVTVDSYGSIWQSDNDDDGNKAVRINYVMEFGNYGYKDEKTGAGWRSSRTGMSSAIPEQHWHLNDPGVVPNLLLTGAGSPTGITVYEGDLLPMFRGDLIHCDAGPNVCRGYLLENDGTGYKAEIRDVLTGTRDKWFRPSDVKVAPDGSLMIADWYDPGVGGHGMGDLDRGRLFRIVPSDHNGKYQTPKFDFTSVDGAIEGLKNPNYAVRAMAWQSLHKRGADAESALAKLASSKNPIYRARAFWLLGKIDGRGKKTVSAAIADDDPNIRIVGVRLARQLNLDVSHYVPRLIKDESPQVRRELLVALRHTDSAQKANWWAELALQHDGHDRWYLEALGLASDTDADACFAAWLERVGDDWNSPAGRDIVWRSRSALAPAYLAKLLQDPATSEADQARYLRAMDFHEATEKEESLKRLVTSAASSAVAAGNQKDKLVVEAVLRLGDFDFEGSGPAKHSVLRYLRAQPGTDVYFDLLSRFKFNEMADDLVEFSLAHHDQTSGVRAAEILFSMDRQSLLLDAMQSNDIKQRVAAVTLVGHAGRNQAVSLLLPLVTADGLPNEVRVAALEGISRRPNGRKKLLDLVVTRKLPNDLKFAAANVLLSTEEEVIRNEAAKYLELPATADSQPLPPLATLVKRRGDVAAGAEVFRKTGTCINCHKVNGEGKEVGPDLSEIGSKLSREAMYVSILDPSAAVSHNFETYSLLTDDGSAITGLLVSDTAESVTLRNAEGIDQTVSKEEIEIFQKQSKSLMPQDLQRLMTANQLVNLVEYTLTLTKK